MRNLMLKSLLSLLVGLFATGCGWGQGQAKDTFLWTKKHVSFVEKQPIWKKSEAEVHAYFGFDYRNFNDSMQDYHGDPLGPIVGIWKTTQYIGRKPNFKDCGERPELPESVVWNTPEYDEAVKIRRKKYEARMKCIRENTAIKEKSKTIKYYYARSTNNHQPIIPTRTEEHALYEAHMTFGPLGGVPLEKLSKAHQAIKDKLERWYCRGNVNNEGRKDCYRLPGKESSIYYKVRSILKEPKATDGMASAPWQSPDFIHDSPNGWEEIKGIEISKAQYDYLYEKYKQSPTKPIVFRLDNNAPDLSKEQKSYIKATTWDADSDDEAYENLLKEFYK